MGRRLIRLLEAAVAEPARAIGALPILEPAERDTILRGWNDTAQPVRSRATPATLPALFAAQAARTPDAAAVVFEDRSADLRRARCPRQPAGASSAGLGVGPETMVGLCVERSPEMVVGLLGILKAGGAYLPLDPNYPRERLAFMLADAGAPVLVTQQALLDRLPERAATAPHRAARRRLAGDRAAARTPRRRSTSIPHHPAYVIYTSGSTGTPKGVVVEHVSLANTARYASVN